MYWERNGTDFQRFVGTDQISWNGTDFRYGTERISWNGTNFSHGTERFGTERIRPAQPNRSARQTARQPGDPYFGLLWPGIISWNGTERIAWNGFTHGTERNGLCGTDLFMEQELYGTSYLGNGTERFIPACVFGQGLTTARTHKNMLPPPGMQYPPPYCPWSPTPFLSREFSGHGLGG